MQERQQVWLRLVDDCLVVSTTVAFDRLPDGGNFSGHSYAAKGDSDGCRACGRVLLRRAIDCGQKASALSSSGRGSDGQGRTSHERFARAGSEVRHPASERVASA